MGKRKGEPVHGWINFNKPQGLTSTQALGKVRRILNAQKAGHAGTLDPLATGVLPIALGEATKTIPFMQDAPKTYLFTVKWGEERDTDDSEGAATATSPVRPTAQAIEAILPRFIGEIEQLPPRYSALKVDGQRAYDLAREGEEPDLLPRPVYIESLRLLASDADTADFECCCGKGTYVRSLARDMGQALGCYGHVIRLCRTSVGPFRLEEAISLDFSGDLPDKGALEDVMLPVEAVLDDIPALPLSEREAARLKQGQGLFFISRPDMDRLTKAGLDGNGDETALALFNGKALALVSVDGPEIRPLRVLNL